MSHHHDDYVDDENPDYPAGDEGDFAEWEEEDDEDRATRCVFGGGVLHPTPAAALTHAANAHGFDLRAIVRANDLDFYGVIQCLNYARSVAAERERGGGGGGGDGDATAAAKDAIEGIAAGKHRDEKYLVPALENDPLLFDWEEYVKGGGGDVNDDDDDDELERRAKAAANANANANANDADADADAATLRAALAAARAERDAMRLRVLELAGKLGETPLGVDVNEDAPANVGLALLGGSRVAAAPPPPARRPPAARRPPPGPNKTAVQEVDDGYFSSYAAFDIHRTMLDDVPRTRAYRVALEKNPTLTAGATVLDVGCGTGILSMFAARGGAASVVGVDGAAAIADVARANVRDNGLSDKVTIVHGKLEELLREEEEEEGEGGGGGLLRAAAADGSTSKFDVLVSEWMGYGLLYESMLDTVIAARDALLKPGGAVLPDVATIHVAGFGRNATSLPFWDDVYGFRMPEVQSRLIQDAARSGFAVVCPVKGEHVVTSSAEVQRLDLATMTVKDTEFTSSECVLTARGDGVRGDEEDASARAGGGRGADGFSGDSDPNPNGPVSCHGVVLWFDTEFSARFCVDAPTTLSTSPYEEKTHWAQAMLHFPEPIFLHPDGCLATTGGGGGGGSESESESDLGGEARPAHGVKVRVGMAKCDAARNDHRALDVSLEWVPVDADGNEGGKRRARIYKL